MQKSMKIYCRVTDCEREEFSRGLSQGLSFSEIARRSGRSTSTVSREIKLGQGITGYRAFSAGNRAEFRAASRRKDKRRLNYEIPLRKYVLTKLIECWSPEEIVMRLKKDFPNDENMRISHESIYQFIYVLPRGELKKTLLKGLRQERKHRRKKFGNKGNPEEKRGKIADMLSIEERPAEVADRTVPGHWEGDLIMGKHKRSALGTLVERTTRKTILVPLKEKDAQSVRKAYVKSFVAVPKELTKTLTYDQGKEMSEHGKFSIATGMKVYFAHPGSPWERGTNENTNGLIRQYFPKGTDFSKVSHRRIKEVERQLNNRPRKALNWYKPDEVFNKLVALKV